MGGFATLEEVNSFLGVDASKSIEQYGTKGMRWGVRKRRSRDTSPVPVTVKTAPGQRVQTSGGQNRPPTDDAKRAAALKQKAKASSIDALSNSEIQTLVARMNLEQQYNKLNPPKQNAAKKFLKGIAKTEIESLGRGKPGPGLSMLQDVLGGSGDPGTHRKADYVGKRRKK